MKLISILLFFVTLSLAGCGNSDIQGNAFIVKGGGDIKGMLIAKAYAGSAAVDKITGANGHPFGMYHIDEMQSTPIAPVKASPNFRQNCRHSWITGSGNYDLEEDALGLNTIPIQGWKNVDETTHIYESQNILGIRTLCIHYNNLTIIIKCLTVYAVENLKKCFCFIKNKYPHFD